VTLDELPELAKDSKLPIWHRVHLIPRAKTLITLGDGADSLVLRKFDLAEALDAEGIDYLFVESSAPATAVRGVKYNYPMAVRSKKGGVKFELQTGPRGMTVSKDGVVSWIIPPGKIADPKVTVIVQISDASGQTIFHTFNITIGEATGRR
jgi:hypothetical protein